jgi:hypothetical protein
MKQAEASGDLEVSETITNTRFKQARKGKFCSQTSSKKYTLHLEQKWVITENVNTCTVLKFRKEILKNFQTFLKHFTIVSGELKFPL